MTMEKLEELLANEVVLYQKTRLFHWNIVGDLFYPLHAQYEEQYTQLATFIDELAERIRKLGGFVSTTLALALQKSTIKEADVQKVGKESVELLLNDHEQLVTLLKKALATDLDAGTEDMLIEILRYHEKVCWELRSMLAN